MDDIRDTDSKLSLCEENARLRRVVVELSTMVLRCIRGLYRASSDAGSSARTPTSAVDMQVTVKYDARASLRNGERYGSSTSFQYNRKNNEPL